MPASNIDIIKKGANLNFAMGAILCKYTPLVGYEEKQKHGRANYCYTPRTTALRQHLWSLITVIQETRRNSSQGRTQGGLGLNNLHELDILQKLYYLRKGG